ncbi:6-phosphogluconolactonase [Salinispira pacifica]
MHIVHGDREELDRRAVEFAVSKLSAAVSRSGQAVLGLPGGRSVSGLLKGLSRAALSWESVHIFLADERRVPPDSPDSNYKEINELLISPLRSGSDIPDEHLHPCTGDAEEYSRSFASVSPRFDLLVLGAGEDGHVASLFPGRPELSDTDRSFVNVHGAPKPPPDRVSVSPTLLTRSAAILLLFYGESKREALHRFLDEQTDTKECPAKLAGACRELLVLTDQPAE